MGQIPGEDYDLRDACTHCFNEAAALAKGTGWLNTPKYMRATFSGVVLCPPAVVGINGSWILTQLFPCEWIYVDALVGIDFTLYTVIPANESLLLVSTNERAWKPIFTGNDVGCSIEFNNNLMACTGNNHGKNGSCVLSWGPGIAL